MLRTSGILQEKNICCNSLHDKVCVCACVLMCLNGGIKVEAVSLLPISPVRVLQIKFQTLTMRLNSLKCNWLECKLNLGNSEMIHLKLLNYSVTPSQCNSGSEKDRITKPESFQFVS